MSCAKRSLKPARKPSATRKYVSPLLPASSGRIGLIANTKTASAKTPPIAGRSAPISRSCDRAEP